MLDRDGRLLARYGEQLTMGSGPRALVAPSGRVIASQPLGWLPVERLILPPGGGELPVDGERSLVAEVLGCEEAYVVSATPEPTSLQRPAGGRSSATLSLSLLGRDRADADLEGGRQQLRLRHSEILTLLCGHPEGMTSEELSVEIYGSPDRAGGIRVEMSRLRKQLGDWIETEHYRLRRGVANDFAQVCGLLHRGAVREAVARYPGPLLPASSAPGVVRERDALESWLRQSVMSSGDQEALWTWLQTPNGTGDLPAWQRLLANLPFQDPRRSLAASRIGQLRSHAAGAAIDPAV
jgi:hypothetical protein